MGCHTLTYANRKDFENDKECVFEFIFRVFDYQEDILDSYDKAEKFVLDTFNNSTNKKPKITTDEPNTFLTYTGEMKGKILFADNPKLANNINNDKNLTDPTYTLINLRRFYDKYPNGIICFG